MFFTNPTTKEGDTHLENERVDERIAFIAERLAAAAGQLESAIAVLEERHAHVCGDVQRIVATAEGAFGNQQDAARLDLERKLAAAEQRIVSLQAQVEANIPSPVRRTAMANPVQMFSKSGSENVGTLEAGTLDAALTGLSLEQRIAVKAQLARAGYLS